MFKGTQFLLQWFHEIFQLFLHKNIVHAGNLYSSSLQPNSFQCTPWLSRDLAFNIDVPIQKWLIKNFCHGIRSVAYCPWFWKCGCSHLSYWKAKRIKYNSIIPIEVHVNSPIQITEVRFLSRCSCASDLYSELSWIECLFQFESLPITLFGDDTWVFWPFVSGGDCFRRPITF